MRDFAEVIVESHAPEKISVAISLAVMRRYVLRRYHSVENSDGVGWATCSGGGVCAGEATASKMAAAWLTACSNGNA